MDYSSFIALLEEKKVRLQHEPAREQELQEITKELMYLKERGDLPMLGFTGPKAFDCWEHIFKWITSKKDLYNAYLAFPKFQDIITAKISAQDLMAYNAIPYLMPYLSREERHKLASISTEWAEAIALSWTSNANDARVPTEGDYCGNLRDLQTLTASIESTGAKFFVGVNLFVAIDSDEHEYQNALLTFLLKIQEMKAGNCLTKVILFYKNINIQNLQLTVELLRTFNNLQDLGMYGIRPSDDNLLNLDDLHHELVAYSQKEALPKLPHLRNLSLFGMTTAKGRVLSSWVFRSYHAQIEDMLSEMFDCDFDILNGRFGQLRTWRVFVNDSGPCADCLLKFVSDHLHNVQTLKILRDEIGNVHDNSMEFAHVQPLLEPMLRYCRLHDLVARRGQSWLRMSSGNFRMRN